MIVGRSPASVPVASRFVPVPVTSAVPGLSGFVIPSRRDATRSSSQPPRPPHPRRPHRRSRGRRPRLPARRRRRPRHEGRRRLHESMPRSSATSARRRPPTSTPTTARRCSQVLRGAPQDDPIARHVAVHPPGDRGLRGQPVLRAQRRRRQGRGPRVRRQPAGRRRLPGRVDTDHAVRPDGAARRRRPRRRSLEATEQTTARKLREMRLAIELEKRVSKQEILERYLNSAYFGHRAYGIFAAAQVFFSKSPADLDLAEAALLAGLVKAPSAYDPASQRPEAATDRRNYVIDQMPSIGYLTAGQAAAGQAAPIAAAAQRPAERLRLGDRRSTTTGASSATTSRTGGWSSRRSARNPQEREENLRRGGYKVVTSLDPKIQQIAMNDVTSQGAEGQHVRARRGGDRARHRPDQGDGGEPQVLPRPEQQRQAHRPRRSAGRSQGQLPEHGEPAARRRRHGGLPGRIDFQGRP